MVAFAAIMADHPGFRIRIDGRTDNVGDTGPIADKVTKTGHAKDRRVDFTVARM